MAEGKNNAAIASTLFLAESSVEKVIHSIFAKLGLPWQEQVHRRVKAVLVYLADQDSVSRVLQSRISRSDPKSSLCTYSAAPHVHASGGRSPAR